MAFPAGSKGGGFTVAFPDVCKTPTPAGPVPIPYPNIAQTAQAKQQAKKVKVGGNAAALKGKSAFKKSTGNEAATRSLGAGVMSPKARGEVLSLKARMNALNVKIQGLSLDQPEQWQGVLQDYAVTASALYTTLKPD